MPVVPASPARTTTSFLTAGLSAAGLGPGAPEDPAEGRPRDPAEHGPSEPGLPGPEPAHRRLQPALRAHTALRPQDRGTIIGDIW